MFDGFEEEDPSADFDAACGGSGTSAHGHEHEEEEAGLGRPLVEVLRSEAGGGHHGDDLEDGGADGLADGVFLTDEDEVEGDCEGGGEEDIEVDFGFFLGFPPRPFFLEEPGIEHEADTAEDHEEGEPEFYSQVVIGGDTFISGAEAAGGYGGEGMAEGFVGVHAHGDQAEGAEDGECGIDLPEAHGEVLDARLDAAGSGFGGGLVLEEGFAADAERGEQCDEEDEDAESAEPLGEGAPEEDGAGVMGEVGYDGGAGGGESGHGLEEGLDGAEAGLAEDVGQGAEGGADEPAEADDSDGFLAEDFAAGAASEEQEDGSGHGSDGDGQGEGSDGSLVGVGLRQPGGVGEAGCHGA